MVQQFSLKFPHIEIQNFQTTSVGEMTKKIRILDLEEFYNFVIDNFSFEIILSKENYAWISYIWKFKFPNDLE